MVDKTGEKIMVYYQVQKVMQVVMCGKFGELGIVPMRTNLRENWRYIETIYQDVGITHFEKEEAIKSFDNYKNRNPTWDYRLIKVVT